MAWPRAYRGIAMRLRAFLSCAVALALPLPASAAACTVPPLPPITHAGPNGNAQLVYLLDPATYPEALCNDGTPAGYIFRPGSGDGVQRWVVELQGGGACEDNATCATRAENLVSTAGLISGVSPGGTLDGILSVDRTINPDFYDANAVRVLYCSSDFWTGNKRPSQVPFNRANAADTWYFQGRVIAEAVMEDLGGKGFHNADQVLLTGDSAGGVGIILDANDVLKLAPASARTIVAGDAGFTLNIGAFDPNSPSTGYVSRAQPTPIETIIEQGHAFWGGRGDLACTSQAPTAAARLKCYNTAMVISQSFVAPPVFTAEALDDLAQLSDDGLPAGRPKTGTPAFGYATSFATAMTETLRQVGPNNAVYAPYAFIHEMFVGKQAGAEAFDTPHMFPPRRTVTPQQAVGNWYLDPCAGTKRIGTTLEAMRSPFSLQLSAERARRAEQTGSPY
jgi:Pectinacetylesterase